MTQSNLKCAQADIYVGKKNNTELSSPSSSAWWFQKGGQKGATDSAEKILIQGLNHSKDGECE